MRVDRHHAFTTMAENGFTAQQSAQIVAQMRDGRSMDIHFHPQDMEKATYHSLTLFGFNQALSIGQRVLDQLPRSPEASR